MMLPPIPVMLCAKCGAFDVPVVGKALGKHTVELRCRGCDERVKVVPRALVQAADEGSGLDLID